MQNLVRKSSFIIVALSFGFLMSCGDQPQLKPQGSADVKLPAFVGFGGGFDLLGQVSSRNYEGPLIIWRADAPPAKLATVLAMSKELKVFDARFKPLKLQYDALLGGIQLAQKKVAAGVTSLAKDVEEPFNKHYSQERNESQSALKASRWYEDRLDPAAKPLFAAFCDAQIWRMASLLIAQEETYFNYQRFYNQRPMPLGVCEAYYKGKSYFKNEACADSSMGKDYSSCYWGDSGVGATGVSILKETKVRRRNGYKWVYLPVEAAEKAEFFAKLGDDRLRQGLDRSQFLRNSLLTLGTDTYKIVTGLKVADEDLTIDTVLEMKLSDFMLSDCGQENKNAADALLTIMSKYLSPNDRLYNIHAIVNKENEDFFWGVDLTEKMREWQESLPQLFGRPIPLQDGYQKIIDFLQAPAQLNTLLASRKKLLFGSKMEQNKQAWWQHKFKTRDFAVDNNLVHMLLPLVQLTLDYSDNKLLANLRLDHGKGDNTDTKVLMQGCFDFEKSKSVACSDLGDSRLAAEPDSLPLRVFAEASTGKLTLAFTIFDPKRQGLSQNVENNERDLRYQEFAASELFGKQMRFEIYPRSFSADDGESKVNTINGKAFIDGHDSVLEGSLSLAEAGNLKTLYSLDPAIMSLCVGDEKSGE